MAAAPSRAHRKRERGTTLTEAAFVTLPFFMLIFGIMEMGFLFRNYLTVSNTAAEASRAASVYGSDAEADFQIMRSAEHGIAAMGLQDLNYLVVWRATGPDDSVPDLCRPDLSGGTRRGARGQDIDPTNYFQVDTTGTNPECNTYLPGDFSLNLADDTDNDGIGDTPTEHFGCQGQADTVDWGWCPLVRADAVSDGPSPGNELGPDYVGIYVSVDHSFLTGFFQSRTTLTSTKIIRIEPEEN